jgi:hypothetical protein
MYNAPEINATGGGISCQRVFFRFCFTTTRV